MRDAPELHPSLHDSAVQAQLQILLALADGLSSILDQPATAATFEASDLSINKIVSHIGTVAAAHINSGLEAPSALAGIWDAAMANPLIKGARPGTRKLLEMSREDSARKIKRRRNFSVFETSNRCAYQFVRDTLAKYSLSHVMPAETAALEIFYDVQAKHFCAGSTRIAKRIRWALQPVSHALKALLLADSILAHEYLSHFVPQNSYLDQSVREGWLTAALVETIHSTPVIARWKRTLWTDYRQDLYRHYLAINAARPEVANAVAFEGFHGLENQVMRVHSRSPAQFWRVTAAILEQPDGNEGAEEVRWLMNQIVNYADEAVKLLTSDKLFTLQELLDIFSN
jgi:hypothetical protein